MTEVNQENITRIKAVSKFMLRGDTDKSWEEKNPVLAEREPGLLLEEVTDENGEAVRRAIGFKIGDGATPWEELALYRLANPDQTYSPESGNAQSGKAVAEALEGLPKLYTGTEISSSDPSMLVGVSDEIKSGTETIIKQPYKVGDIYLNTDENRVYQCVSISDYEGINYYDFIGLNYVPDSSYNPESANAQSGKAVAEALRNKVERKNLIPYPYLETTQTLNGITFTDNGDGTITLNGTAEKEALFSVQYVNLKKGVTYTLSGCPEGGVQYNGYWLSLSSYTQGSGYSVTFTPDFDIENMPVWVGVSAGTACDNLVFKPQLEIGDVATSYAPYTLVYQDLSKKADKSVIGDIETALDSIIAIQEQLISGGSV